MRIFGFDSSRHNGMTSAATRDTSAWQVGEGPSRREAP